MERWDELIAWINSNVTNKDFLRGLKGYGISVDESLKDSYRPTQQMTNSGIAYEAASNRNAENTQLVYEKIKKVMGL